MNIKGKIVISGKFKADDIAVFINRLPDPEMWSAEVGENEMVLSANYTRG